MKLKAELEKYDIHQPQIPVVYNISGKEEDGNLIDILTKQNQIKCLLLSITSIHDCAWG